MWFDLFATQIKIFAISDAHKSIGIYSFFLELV